MAADEADALTEALGPAAQHIATVTRDPALAQHVAAEAEAQLAAYSAGGKARFTAAKRAIFLAELAGGKSLATACETAGITIATAYNTRNKSPAFERAWQLAYDYATDKVEDILMEKAGAREIAAVIFALKGRRPDRWREQSNTQINVQVNVTERLDAARQRLKSTRG